MMTGLFNHLIGIYSSSYTRDDRGGIVRSRAVKANQSSVPGRVEVYAPRKITRQQQFDFGSRQIVIDHLVYTEATGIANGDDIEYPAGSGTFFRVEGIITFPAQGRLPTYFLIGAVELKN